MSGPNEIHTVPRDYARRHPEYAAGLTAAQPYLSPTDARRETMANQPQSQPPQSQGQPPQPQAQAAPQTTEQHLLGAGVQPQHLQQARAFGLDPQAVLNLLAQFLPVVLQVLQQIQAGRGGGGQPQPAPGP